MSSSGNGFAATEFLLEQLENPSDLCVQVCDCEEHSDDFFALDQPARFHMTIVEAKR